MPHTRLCSAMVQDGSLLGLSASLLFLVPLLGHIFSLCENLPWNMIRELILIEYLMLARQFKVLTSIG